MNETPAEAWARCRPWIEAALEKAGGTHGVEDVARLIERGCAHFWPGRRSAAVTEFCDYPRFRACNLWLLGGDLKELAALQPKIEAWARAQGCRQLQAGGLAQRRGWERVGAALGFAPRWTVYAKELR